MNDELKITLNDLLKADPNLSVILKKEKLKELHSLIKSKYKSVKKFSKIVGYCPQALFNWLSGKRNPKLRIMIKICRFLTISLETFVEKIICLNEPYRSFIPIDTFPIIGDENLASLVGHSLGDGHVGISYEYTNKCKELLNEVKLSVNKLPVKNIKVIHNLQPNKTPTLVFPKLVRNILVCAGAPIGNKITNSFRLPSWIKNGNKKIKGTFLRALFDDEGNVSPNRIIRLSLSKRIDLLTNLHSFFVEMKSLLEDLGIKRTIIKESKGETGKNGETFEVILSIYGFSNFKIFSKLIKFNNPKKTKSLNKLLENEIIKSLKGGTKEKIIDILENDTLTMNELSKKLGLSFQTTWEHLIDLESKGLISKVKGNAFSFQHRASYEWHKKI